MTWTYDPATSTYGVRRPGDQYLGHPEGIPAKYADLPTTGDVVAATSKDEKNRLARLRDAIPARWSAPGSKPTDQELAEAVDLLQKNAVISTYQALRSNGFSHESAFLYLGAVAS